MEGWNVLNYSLLTFCGHLHFLKYLDLVAFMEFCYLILIVVLQHSLSETGTESGGQLDQNTWN